MSTRMGLSPIELRWLRTLAGGTTTGELAVAEGYSERHMRRMLADLYRRLGSTGRVPALVAAAKMGLLDEREAARASSEPHNWATDSEDRAAPPGPVDG